MKQLILSMVLAFVVVIPAWAQEEAGRAVLVVGQATVTDANGAARTLRKGDVVFSGETISTLRHSYVNVKYRDEGRTLIGPNSQLKIEEFSYAGASVSGGPRQKGGAAPAGDAAQGRSVFSLIKGGFRAVTGLIGKMKREDYVVKTSVATIGIRGTDFIVFTCDGQCQADMPDGVNSQGGNVIGVFSGGLAVGNAAGGEFALEAGSFLLVTSSGEFIPLQSVPAFMALTPLEDPKKCD